MIQNSLRSSSSQVQGTGIKTYILKFDNNKYYCGKTRNLDRRIREHNNLKIKNRIIDIIFIVGDFEKRIKFCGVRNMYKLISGFKKFMVKPEQSEVLNHE